MLNVNFEAMREEIDKIFEAYEKDCISKSEMKQQLLNLHSVSHSIDCYKCGSKKLKPTEYKCNDCGHNGYYD